MHKQYLTFLLITPLALSLQARPRIYPTGTKLLARQTPSCGTSTICEGSCMPIDAVCCEDGSSTYCPNGDRCVTGGCCPLGETCHGGGGTMTYYDIFPIETSTSSSSSTSGSSGSGSSGSGSSGSDSSGSGSGSTGAASPSGPLEKSFIGGLILAAGCLLF